MLTSTINPYPVDADSRAGPSTEGSAARRKTKSEDLSILAHAQGQLRSHLEPAQSETYHSQTYQREPYQRETYQGQNQHQHLNPQCQYQYQSQYQYQYQSRSQPSFPLHSHPPHYPPSAPRPRSAHQLRPAGSAKPDLRTPVSHLPFRWWERGIDDEAVEDDDDEEDDVRESVECDVDESVVESIEMDDRVSPLTGVSGEGCEELEAGIGEEARIWDEAQRSWNGYVQHKESWVRRAGLKREREREREGGERSGGGKRGRASGGR